MAKQTFYRDIAGLNKALRALPKLASARLRDASVIIAEDVAGLARQRAMQTPGPAKLVAPTIRAGRDRVPAIKMGSAKRIPGRTGERQTIGDLIYGAEFGGGRRDTTQQFLPWRGSGSGSGYFLWPAIRADHDYIHDEYSKALLAALNEVH